MSADNNKKYYLGIDQGGTKTAALICDLNGNILGAGYDEGLGTKEQFTGILDVSMKVCAQSGIKPEEIKSVCGGLSGADWESDYPAMTESLANALGMNITDVLVLNDCMIACRGGTSSRNRAVVCAGTALNIGVRRADGKEFLYGYFISINDIVNGGVSLGLAAFRAVAESYHGIRGHTMLTDLVLNYTGHANAEQLLFELMTGRYNWNITKLAPFVMQANFEDDCEAIKIIDKFAKENAKYVKAAIKQVDIHNCDIDLVFSGGIFKNKGTLAADKIYQFIIESDASELNGCTINKIHARYEPVCGALLTLLDQRYDGDIPPKVTDNFNRGCEAFKLIRDI